MKIEEGDFRARTIHYSCGLYQQYLYSVPRCSQVKLLGKVKTLIRPDKTLFQKARRTSGHRSLSGG